MIDIVISVRNRANWRIQQCVNNFLHPRVSKIYVVDYGSDKPIKNIKNAIILNYTKEQYPIWNKSHALNLGIKKSKSYWIATVDVDMILPKDFIDKINEILDSFEKIKEDVFLYTTNVRRTSSRKGTFNQRWRFSKSWFIKNQYTRKVDGGIQIFNYGWCEKVCGYDENLIYWGGPDNDMHNRALYKGTMDLNLNIPILHQEHDKQKEYNLSEKEREFAIHAKQGRGAYLLNKEINRVWKNGNWGNKIPFCPFRKITPLEKIETTKDILERYLSDKSITKKELAKELKKKNKNISICMK